MSEYSFPAAIKERPRYLSNVSPFIGKNLIKVLTGQRRVGKSYLLFQLMQHIQQQDSKANIIYINKEDLQFAFIKDASDLNAYILSKSSKTERNYIFIDEIQDIVEFERAIRSLLLNENNDIYITGSNAKMLSGELATYLSGRYVEFPVYSLSYPEFLLFHHLENTDENLMHYFLYGGLPYLIHLPLNNLCFEYLKSVYATILLRDVVSRYHVRNTAFLEKLVAFLAGNIGHLFSAKKISDFLKSQQINLSPNQIQIYADFLASSFLIHKVSRYDIRGRRLFETGDKYYFENMGIRNTITGYKPNDLGLILENVVYNHLLYQGWQVNVGTLHQSEIDFVCQRNGERQYIQVALRLDEEQTISREFGNLLKIPDAYPKFVVSNQPFYGNTYEGIKHVYIRDFLMSK